MKQSTANLWLQALTELNPYQDDKHWEHLVSDFARRLQAAVANDEEFRTSIAEAVIVQQFLLEVATGHCTPTRSEVLIELQQLLLGAGTPHEPVVHPSADTRRHPLSVP